MVTAKHNLLQMYGRTEGYLIQVKTPLLTEMVEGGEGQEGICGGGGYLEILLAEPCENNIIKPDYYKINLVQDMTEEQLNRKIQLCRENLDILKKIDPNMIRYTIRILVYGQVYDQV